MSRVRSLARVALVAGSIAAFGTVLGGIGRVGAAPPQPPVKPAASTSASVTADDPSSKAADEFRAGTAYVKSAKWGEALAAFERANAIQRHALTLFNMGACERALGHYTRARRTLEDSLAQNQTAGGTELGTSHQTDARAWIAEVNQLVIHLQVTIVPGDAAVLVDGRPLLREDRDGKTLWIAGMLPPGPGTVVEGGKLELVADPGSHVFTLRRKGFSDVVVNRSDAPGTHAAAKLELDRLPASIHVESDQPNAIVTLAGKDVGVAPVDVSRPAGSYAVSITVAGYEPYRTTIDVKPGEQANLKATMVPETVSLTKKWWFWTAASVAVTGAAVGTYFLARPEPERPAPDGGGLGWVLRVP